VPSAGQIAAARALGMGRSEAWARVVLPQVCARIRLPVYVTLAFSLSVVDMAIILGPSTPPTLAVAVARWLQAPDVTRMMPGAAGALAQLGLVLLAAALWAGAERALAVAARALARRGARRSGLGPALSAAGAVAAGLTLIGLLALVVLAIWSFVWRWPYPQALPTQWSLRLWAGGDDGLASTAVATLDIAAAATLLALALAIGWLQAEGPRTRRLSAMLYLPLLVPQVSFLSGLDIVFLRAGLAEGRAAVIWGHLLYVLPYVMIVLAGPWRAFDTRLEATAAALGAGPVRRLVTLRLPMLLGPLSAAAAVGVAVSVAQYLPTLFLGAGRVVTLTTEAVTLSSGADRRIAASYALMQAALPWLGFVVALALPAIAFRNRRGLRGGGL
jgi:putative thiamine transport system permease protein